MTSALSDLAGYLVPGASSFAAVFFRVGAAIALLPAIGERSIPMRVRLILAIAYTAIVGPVVSASHIPHDPAGFTFLALAESLTGLFLGLVFRLAFFGLQMAGAMAAQATSLAQMFGAGMAEPQPVVGKVMTVAGLALLVTAGFHVMIAKTLVTSFAIFPFGQPPLARGLAVESIRQAALAFALSFRLAMPFLVLSTVFNLALGFINRAMPQLMVSFVGAPAITLAAMAVLAISAPFLLSVWLEAVTTLLSLDF